MIQNRFSHGSLCVCIAFALTYICISYSPAMAQKVNNALAQNTQMHFDHVKVGKTQCQPLIAINSTPFSLIVSNVTFTVGAEYFTVSDTEKLLIILKSGESAELGKLCFTAQAANKEFIGYISINYSATQHTNDGEIRIDATTEIDSSLVPCFSVSFDSTLFAPVFYGGEAFRTMSVTNNTDTIKTIRCIDFTYGDSDVFNGFGNQFPMEIASHQTKPIHLVFTPVVPNGNGSDNFRSKVKIESMDGLDACSPEFDIYGNAIRSTDMDIFNPFDRTSILPTLKMSGETEVFGQTFLFQCTDTANLQVNAIVLDDKDTHFVLMPTGACSSLPMVTKPGELLAVRLSLRTNKPIVYYNKLRFILGNGMEPIVYDVQAMRIILQSKVSGTISDQSFSFIAIPNPSSGSIMIKFSEDLQADIDIFDAAGKQITSQKHVSTWIWNGENRSGVPVPSGNYFIRALTHDANGKEIIKTKQVAILRQ